MTRSCCLARRLKPVRALKQAAVWPQEETKLAYISIGEHLFMNLNVCVYVCDCLSVFSSTLYLKVGRFFSKILEKNIFRHYFSYFKQNINIYM